MVREFALVAAQVALLWCMSWIGHAVVTALRLPVPGNVAGLLITFGALSSGVLPLRRVERGAGLLVRNLPLFFVPLAANIVTQGQLLAADGLAILATLIASAGLGFAITGRAAQFVAGFQGNAIVAVK